MPGNVEGEHSSTGSSQYHSDSMKIGSKNTRLPKAQNDLYRALVRENSKDVIHLPAVGLAENRLQ